MNLLSISRKIPMASLNLDFKQYPKIKMLQVFILGFTSSIDISLKISWERGREEGEGVRTMELRRVLQVRREGFRRARFMRLKIWKAK